MRAAPRLPPSAPGIRSSRTKAASAPFPHGRRCPSASRRGETCLLPPPCSAGGVHARRSVGAARPSRARYTRTPPEASAEPVSSSHTQSRPAGCSRGDGRYYAGWPRGSRPPAAALRAAAPRAAAPRWAEAHLELRMSMASRKPRRSRERGRSLAGRGCAAWSGCEQRYASSVRPSEMRRAEQPLRRERLLRLQLRPRQRRRPRQRPRQRLRQQRPPRELAHAA